MDTVNISLPKTLSSKLDDLVFAEGYASRSEFVRTLLRDYLSKKAFTSEIYKPVPLTMLRKDLEDAGYSSKFVESVVLGMSKSSVYAQDQTIKK